MVSSSQDKINKSFFTRFRWLILWTILNLIIFSVCFMNYKFQLKHRYLYKILKDGLSFSRAAAMVINFNLLLVWLPMCKFTLTKVAYFASKWLRRLKMSKPPPKEESILRNPIKALASLITNFWLRFEISTLSNLLIAIDNSTCLHTFCAATITIASVIHTIAHILNVINFSRNYDPFLSNLNMAQYPGQPPIELLLSVPGITGILMLIILALMTFSSVTKIRSKSFNLFQIIHRLSILFVILLFLHPMTHVLKEQINIDRHDPDKCDNRTISMELNWFERGQFKSTPAESSGSQVKASSNQSPADLSKQEPKVLAKKVEHPKITASDDVSSKLETSSTEQYKQTTMEATNEVSRRRSGHESSNQISTTTSGSSGIPMNQDIAKDNSQADFTARFRAADGAREKVVVVGEADQDKRQQASSLEEISGRTGASHPQDMDGKQRANVAVNQFVRMRRDLSPINKVQSQVAAAIPDQPGSQARATQQEGFVVVVDEMKTFSNQKQASLTRPDHRRSSSTSSRENQLNQGQTDRQPLEQANSNQYQPSTSNKQASNDDVDDHRSSDEQGPPPQSLAASVVADAVIVGVDPGGGGSSIRATAAASGRKSDGDYVTTAINMLPIAAQCLDKQPLFVAQSSICWYVLAMGLPCYLIDLFLRKWRRSKTSIQLLAYRSDADGNLIELILSNNHKRFEHWRPGQFVYLNCPQISHFEWHPFTISSMDNSNKQFTLHIKTAGDWTSGLRKKLTTKQQQQRRSQHQSSVVTSRPSPAMLPDGPIMIGSHLHYDKLARGLNYHHQQIGKINCDDVNIEYSADPTTAHHRHLCPDYDNRAPPTYDVITRDNPTLDPPNNGHQDDLLAANCCCCCHHHQMCTPNVHSPNSWSMALEPGVDVDYHKSLQLVPSSNIGRVRDINVFSASSLYCQNVKLDKENLQHPLNQSSITRTMRNIFTKNQDKIDKWPAVELNQQEVRFKCPSLHYQLEYTNHGSPSNIKPPAAAATEYCTYSSPQTNRLDLYIDGPFHSPFERLLEQQVSVCIANGVGWTAFSSIFHNLINNFHQSSENSNDWWSKWSNFAKTNRLSLNKSSQNSPRTTNSLVDRYDAFIDKASIMNGINEGDCTTDNDTGGQHYHNRTNTQNNNAKNAIEAHIHMMIIVPNIKDLMPFFALALSYFKITRKEFKSDQNHPPNNPIREITAFLTRAHGQDPDILDFCIREHLNMNFDENCIIVNEFFRIYLGKPHFDVYLAKFTSLYNDKRKISVYCCGSNLVKRGVQDVCKSLNRALAKDGSYQVYSYHEENF